MPIFPVPLLGSTKPRISDGYGVRSSGKIHSGVDLMYRRPEKGTAKLPVYSKHYFLPEGIAAIAYDGGVVTTSKEIGTGGYIVIEHPDGMTSQYMHVKNRVVAEGQTVEPGQTIATVFHNTSKSGYKLNHLHFQLRKDGKLVDPEPYLRKADVVSAPRTTKGMSLRQWFATVFLGWGIWRLADRKKR